MIRCLLSSHWSTARLRGYALTPPHGLCSVRDQILIPSHWGPTHLCRCTLTPPCWLMTRRDQVLVSITLEHDPLVWRWTSPSFQRLNHLVIGHHHHRFVVRSARDDPLVTVRLLNDSVVIHYWPLPHQTNTSGDDKTTNSPYIWRWQNCFWFLQCIY
jgi:hypothetical protein